MYGKFEMESIKTGWCKSNSGDYYKIMVVAFTTHVPFLHTNNNSLPIDVQLELKCSSNLLNIFRTNMRILKCFLKLINRMWY